MMKYEKYKNSGVQWIEDIPNNWTLGRVKNLTYVKARIGWQGMRSDEFVDNSDWYCVTGTDFKDGLIDWSNCYCIEEWRYNQDKKIQLKERDILITKDGTIGKVAFIVDLPKKTTLNSGVFVTRPYFNSYKAEYFYWLLNSNVFKKFIDYFKNGSTILHLYQNVFERFIFPIPPLQEQTAIAEYLDIKTQAIDKKISLLEQKIISYKALRKTLINDTVTKGLDKNVKLKNSGIEWIGEIPEHWKVKRFKDVVNKFIGGGTPNTSNTDYWVEESETSIPWVSISDITKSFKIFNTEKHITKEALKSCSAKIIKKDTILYSIYASLGKVAITGRRMATNQAILSIYESKLLNKFFFIYFLNKLERHISSFGNSNTQNNIGLNILSRISITTPPKQEQIAIAEYLDKKTRLIDDIVSNIETQIEKLKELRKTLINDVVTGKIKVVE